MAHRFDATLKDIVAEHPADFAAPFGLPANEPATPLKSELSSIYKGIGLMQESTAFDEVMEEGERRGESRGERRGKISVLLRQGSKRFGIPDAATEAELTAIQDLDRLEHLADAILTANSWSELLATS